MSDIPSGEQENSAMELLLKQNQELLRQNAQLLGEIGKLLEKRKMTGAAPLHPPPKPDDDLEFLMGL